MTDISATDTPDSDQPVSEEVLDSSAPLVIEEPVVEAEAAPTTGQRLRAAREERGMSVNDVAEILRFSPRQISLLEADRYDDLPGATLVRGFIRGYAKLLKLDPVPLLDGLTPEAIPNLVEVKPPTNMGVAEDPSLGDSPLGKALPWGTLLAGAVIVLAIGLIVYFVQTMGPGGNAGAEATTQSSSTMPAVVAPQPSTLAQPESASPGAPVAGAAGATAAPPLTPLVAEFDDRSWIEVRDVAQKIVFVGEYPKGTRQVIEGQAPLQVWVGKASGVRLTYGERSIDLKPHTREEVARLTIE